MARIGIFEPNVQNTLSKLHWIDSTQILHIGEDGHSELVVGTNRYTPNQSKMADVCRFNLKKKH